MNYTIRKISFLSYLKIVVLLPCILFSNSLSKSYFNYCLDQYSYDLGENWNTLTLFSDFIYSKENRIIRSLTLENYINNKPEYYIKFNGYLNFKKHFYFYFNLNQRSNNSGIQNSKIGFINDWVNIEYGKGTENWGSGHKIELALSHYSEPYNFYKLSSDYGNLRVSYLHGFLERLNNTVNRYLVAKGLEWTNKKSLLIGFSETIIYSGKNRTMDIAYLNPLNTHLEVELNNRLINNEVGNTNAVWQFHLDYNLKKKVRASFNYLIDEFVLDPKIEVGKENGVAYSTRIAFPINIDKKYSIVAHFQKIKIGSSTFRHGNGYNNFVNSSKPLGWRKGSDLIEQSTGITFSNKKSILFEISYGDIKTGGENILNNSYKTYQDYLKGPFPSGEIIKDKFLDLNIKYFIQNYYLSLDINFFNNSENQSRICIGRYFKKARDIK